MALMSTCRRAFTDLRYSSSCLELWLVHTFLCSSETRPWADSIPPIRCLLTLLTIYWIIPSLDGETFGSACRDSTIGKQQVPNAVI